MVKMLQKTFFLLSIALLLFVGISADIFAYPKKEGKSMLETERLMLREFIMEDEENLLKLLSDKDVMHFSISGPLDIGGVRNFLQKTFQSYKTYGYGKWAVILKETGEFIGACGIHNVKIDGEWLIEVGYRLAKHHWGKGFATEAARAIRDYGFKTLKLSCLVSCMHPDNIASIRVAEKNGMSYWRNGKFFGVACLVYGIRRDTWAIL